MEVSFGHIGGYPLAKDIGEKITSLNLATQPSYLSLEVRDRN